MCLPGSLDNIHEIITSKWFYPWFNVLTWCLLTGHAQMILRLQPLSFLCCFNSGFGFFTCTEPAFNVFKVAIIPFKIQVSWMSLWKYRRYKVHGSVPSSAWQLPLHSHEPSYHSQLSTSPHVPPQSAIVSIVAEKWTNKKLVRNCLGKVVGTLSLQDLPWTNQSWRCGLRHVLTTEQVKWPSRWRNIAYKVCCAWY